MFQGIFQFKIEFNIIRWILKGFSFTKTERSEYHDYHSCVRGKL